MRQGNGSDLLGANDPRSSTIGIIYVAPNDDRERVLAAIWTQERLKRKQIAVVLPGQNKAFQRPVDFDGLKNMRRELQADLVIIAPYGSSLAEFARQRRFTLFTSLDRYRQSLQQENEASRVTRGGWLFGRQSKLQPIPTNPASTTHQQQPTLITETQDQMVLPSANANNINDRKDEQLAPTNANKNESVKTISYIGQQFGNYRIVSKLASGGSLGDVYLSEHIELGAKVAIKVLSRGKDIDTDEFQNGLRRIARLVHPHIMRILDFGVKDNTPFLVMEYAPDGSLRHLHPRGTQLPLHIVVNYTKQVASALQYVHDHNLLHGHLTPNDMLIGPNSEILLSGFDPIIAHQSSTNDFMSVGYYTAPEQLSGRLLPASDQYALGGIIYEWLSGNVPWPDRRVRLIQPSPVPLTTLVPLPPNVGEIVMKTLAKEPKQRFGSVQEFADELEQASLPGKPQSHRNDRVGQRFGKYRLVRLLGQGAFADVYLGQHESLSTYAAIKVMHTHLSNNDIESFRNEARTIANLRHASIVRVFDYDVENNIPFLVMDQAPYGSLRERHPKGSRLPLPTIVAYVKQVANALQYAHNQKLIHRDVKPENMLIGINNEILLSDFGIAIIAQSTRSWVEQNIAGTPFYMAPEQFRAAWFK